MLQIREIISVDEFRQMVGPTKKGLHGSVLSPLFGIYEERGFNQDEEMISRLYGIFLQLIVFLEARGEDLNRVCQRGSRRAGAADRVDRRDVNWQNSRLVEVEVVRYLEDCHPFIEKTARETKEAPAYQDVSQELEDSLTFSNLVSNICCACVRAVLFLSIH